MEPGMNIYKITFFSLFFFIVSFGYAKTTIAVQNFQTKKCDAYFGEVSSQEFRKVLVENKELRVIDKKSMEDIFKEKKIQSSKCISTECLVKMGKLLAANFIITGNILRIRDIYYISINCIDVETGEIKYSRSAYAKKGEGVLISLSHNLAVEFSNEYFGTNLPLLKLNNNDSGSNVNDHKINTQHSITITKINRGYYQYFEGEKFKKSLKWKEVKSLLLKNPASEPYMEKVEKFNKTFFLPVFVITLASETVFLGGYFVIIYAAFYGYMSDNTLDTLAKIWPYSGILFGLGLIAELAVIQPALDRLKEKAVTAYNSSFSYNNMKLKGFFTLSKNGPQAGLTLVF